MKYISIAGTDLKLSVITLGTWVFSGATWGGSEEADCIAAVHAALDQGINVIDTAPIYGYGRAETLVGKALKGRRDRAIIATKCGLQGKGKHIYQDLSPENIRKEVAESLSRLQTDYIDIYQCHWPDPKTPIEETMTCLMQLQKDRKIRHIGVSNFPLGLLQDALRITRIVTLQSSLSLLQRDLQKEILPFCKSQKIGVLTYGSLGGGILTGKYREPKAFPRDDARNFFYQYYSGEPFRKVRAFLDKMEMLGRPLNELALNWTRQQNGVVSTIAGCRNARQVTENTKAAEWDISDEDMAAIGAALEEFGL